MAALLAALLLTASAGPDVVPSLDVLAGPQLADPGLDARMIGRELRYAYEAELIYGALLVGIPVGTMLALRVTPWTLPPGPSFRRAVGGTLVGLSAIGLVLLPAIVAGVEWSIAEQSPAYDITVPGLIVTLATGELLTGALVLAAHLFVPSLGGRLVLAALGGLLIPVVQVSVLNLFRGPNDPPRQKHNYESPSEFPPPAAVPPMKLDAPPLFSLAF